MKRTMERIISVLLVVCMCATMLFGALPVAEAVTPNYTPSSAYQASSYYSALLDVELTGDQRVDIINVALSQAGYAEGSYTGDTGGADDGSYNNYTEYNYWYHNYINSGMPVGGEYAPWCATFVSWCAEMANVPTSILQRSTAAGHGSYYFKVNFYAGGSTLASSSDNDSYFMGYNYTPKRGDLFFTRSWSHVGLVVDSDGTYVTTVEGNTNDGGSAEGLGVFVRTRYVDDLYFGVPEYVESYASSCTFYPAHCKITIDSATPINSQPCSVSTDADSVNLGTATAGQTYTATGLYLNGYGNYWYRVESDLGESCYLYAGDTTFVEQITSDITFTDYDVPNGHVSGNTFSVTGTIASEYSGLDTASCYIYSGFAPGGEAVTGYSDSVSGNRYSLVNSDIDYNTSFGSLGTGAHIYEIAVSYTNYYATSNTTISYDSGTVVLLSEYFMVVSSSVDQSSCSHSYTTTVVEAGTCTEPGKAVQACSTCGLVNETTTGADGHSYGSWTTVKATCTADGYQKRTCSACGNVETVTLGATGHSYDAVKTEATCSAYAKYTMTCGSCGDSYSMTADQMASSWIEEIPAGMDASLFNSQTQYRYSDYQTQTSTSATAPTGYTLKSSTWVQSGSGSVKYVSEWPSGFSTSSSLYTQYNKKSSKVTASETSTAKTVVNSDAVVGYLYYHWCYTDSYYSVASSSGSYTTFHAYYDTTDPDSYT
ncbi:MAG: CHAP domain-containing protein, partial [Oscillospiraceae bacterium]|nr:CHAP domain-containing protein [Oscillospiraceae bacterium]